MICLQTVKKYCHNYKAIENYEKAVTDTTQTWICHHRREIDEGLSRKQLIENDLYWNRPENELIFLTCSDHNKLHETYKNFNVHGKLNKSWSKERKEKHSEIWKEKYKNGYVSPLFGKPVSEEIRNKHSISMKGKNTKPKTEEHKQHLRESIYGRKWMTNGIDRIFVKKEEIDKYIELGYHFGMKLFKKGE